MPPVARSEAEESSFLDGLFSELDSSTPAVVRSPPRRRVTSSAVHAEPQTPSRAKSIGKSSYATPSRCRSRASPLKREHALHVAQSVDIDSLVEGAEDWDWDDMNSDFMTPHKSSPVVPKRSRYAVLDDRAGGPVSTRCIVLSVHDQFVRGRLQRVLQVKTQPSNELRQVTLLDDWTHADIAHNDVVNVIGEWAQTTSSDAPAIEVSGKHNFLIHHPDVLITATALSNTSQCARKPLLSNMVRSTSDVTPALVWGNILHEVMQTCLSVQRWDEKFVDKKIAEVCQNSLGELIRIDMDLDQAIIEVKSRAKGLKAFAEKYIASEPKPEAVLTNTRASRAETSLLAIPHLYDIEEDIWSPTYGLKGKIDASVEAVVHDVDDASTPFTRAKPKVTMYKSPMPFEIKTGRSVAGMEHRAQTMLYTLLMGERYGTVIPSGLLYYTQSEEVVRVPAARNELRALLVARNEMAGHMMNRLRAQVSISTHENAEGVQVLDDLESCLPPTIDDNRTCGKCYALDTCMLFRKAVEEVEDEDSEIAHIYSLKTGHLSPQHLAFFKKWEALITLEERDLVRFRKELWTMTAREREDKGRCFSDMVLDLTYRPEDGLKPTSHREAKIHRATYRFVKAAAGASSLLSGHIVVGDAVVVSVDPGLFALARGFVVDLAPDAVVLGVDHELDEEMVADRLRGKRVEVPETIVFRIDKDEMFGGMNRIRDNLARVFYAGAETRRLELIVDLAPPRFVDEQDVPEMLSGLEHLNDNQRLAVRTVLRAEDYALILGMPGTGKTTVVAEVIKHLVEAGSSVLLTSYTHSAVDTILMKLDGVNVLRLGNLDKIHPDVQKYTLAARPLAKTIQQLERQLISPPVVATTCLTIEHPLFARRTFDYCIIDEASQITLPTCLGPMRHAKKFILVGDHFQLPPLVKNKAARMGGLDVSLFRRLSDAHPEAVVDLTHQYRMNKEIMLLSNRLIYSNRLRCGTEAVASQSLKLPNVKFLESLHANLPCCRLDCWLSRLMDESCKAVFVDTDDVPAKESKVGDLVENVTEAQIVYQITECMLNCGAEENQIGIISLYRQQLKLLSHLFRDRKGLEILTADRSQGRDKDCIIISLVRSNDEGNLGDLVKDWRRMNVSFTRARSKLIIIGSRKTLQKEPLLAQFFELMEEQRWILPLPIDAQTLHNFGGRDVTTLRKRDVSDMLGLISAQYEDRGTGSAKRRKSALVTGESILKGRPLLRDVVNDAK